MRHLALYWQLEQAACNMIKLETVYKFLFGYHIYFDFH